MFCRDFVREHALTWRKQQGAPLGQRDGEEKKCLFHVRLWEQHWPAEVTGRAWICPSTIPFDPPCPLHRMSQLTVARWQKVAELVPVRTASSYHNLGGK